MNKILIPTIINEIVLKYFYLPFKYDDNKISIDFLTNTITNLKYLQDNTCFIGSPLELDKIHEFEIKINKVEILIGIGITQDNDIIDQTLWSGYGLDTKISYQYWSNKQVNIVGNGSNLKDISNVQKQNGKDGDKILFIYNAIQNIATVFLNNLQIYKWEKVKRINYYFAVSVYYNVGDSITILNMTSKRK